MRLLVSVLALIFLVSCESAPLAGATAGSDEAVVVEILDAQFVKVDGDRQPWEELVYDMRVRCRECRAQGLAMPCVEFRLPAMPDAITSADVDRIQRGLRQAGVRRISMGGQ